MTVFLAVLSPLMHRGVHNAKSNTKLLLRIHTGLCTWHKVFVSLKLSRGQTREEGAGKEWPLVSVTGMQGLASAVMGHKVEVACE